MAEQITLAKKCRRDTMILLFTSAITSAFAECQRELGRLKFGQLSHILKEIISSKNSTKNAAQKLVPGPFVFAKN